MPLSLKTLFFSGSPFGIRKVVIVHSLTHKSKINLQKNRNHIIKCNDLNQYLFDLSHFILKSISPSPFLKRKKRLYFCSLKFLHKII